MLDADTKRKINNARDILVGKVPDPKSQVEQITIALVYKFMDDMDKESEELGGKPRFFTSEFKEYAWTKLMDPKLGGHDRLNLYAESIEKMNHNKNIPQLFRDIFKDAFLPYRDPETLNLFLKEINSFTYDHSEQLGNAYEYLLSVLSSQGDAGQFRTPRHIIDFIVEVIDPDKDDTILDPACGTAGFLISAYKHILEKHKKETLTPDEKAKLTHQFVGYDISPDMVRLSLVNMYLHSFPYPQVYEYDTLTSEDRWDERFDVIMANPPFMTPKGGIRPHQRFSVKASRSEVLFVDYFAEHLTVDGRAGVIVPEGIIFQSSNAYKALRKMLVDEHYLYAVVSLPAGVFNPYSGVKTSILLMDKKLAKRTKEILFVKVENDGYDLGAQRRPIDKNDLPQALEIIKQYKKTILEGKSGKQISDVIARSEATRQSLATLAPKSKIAQSSDYNLSASRYIEEVARVNQKWPKVELGKVCKLGRGFAFKSTDYVNKGILNFRVSNIGNDGYPDLADVKFLPEKFRKQYSQYLLNEDDFVIVMVGATTGKVGKITKDILPALLNQNMWRFFPDRERLSKEFLYHVVKNFPLIKQGGARDYLKQSDFLKAEVPLPPLEIQKEIVAELDRYQKIISGAKQIIQNYKPTIKIDPDWGIVELGSVCSFEYGKPLKEENRKSGDYPVFGSNGIVGYHDEYLVEGPFIIIGRKGTAGAVVYSEKSGFPIDTTFYVKLLDKEKVLLKFLYHALLILKLDKVNTQAGVPGLNRNDAYKLRIPLPSIETQKQIITQIEEEQKLVDANKKLIEIFEQKIQDRISYIWS